MKNASNYQIYIKCYQDISEPAAHFYYIDYSKLQRLSMQLTLLIQLNCQLQYSPSLFFDDLDLICIQTFIIKSKRMIKKTAILVTLVLLETLIKSQSAEELKINTSIQILITPENPKYYLITFPQGSNTNDDLYIRADPKVPDPLQEPYLEIMTNQGYTQECYRANVEFAGICRVDHSILNSHKQITLIVKCISQCSITLSAQLSKTVPLALGQDINLIAHEDLTQIIHVNISQIDFDSIAIIAAITNYQQSLHLGQEGVELLINFGTGEIKDPTQKKYQMRGNSLNGGGKGVFIHKDKIKSNGTVACYLHLKKGLSVRFSVSPLKGSQFSVGVGNAYYDFVMKDTEKIYTINVKNYEWDINEMVLEVVFDIYSGDPEFLISFDKDFSKVVEFNKVSTAASILISPQIKKKFQSTQTLYIKVRSNNTSQYYFYTQFIGKDVTIIQPYLTYFDELSFQDVENYFLFEHYKFPTSQKEQLKDISFKIEITSGQGAFYLKRCADLQLKSKDNPNFGQCVVKDFSTTLQLTFLEQQLPGIRSITSGNKENIMVSYDISKCTEVSTNESQTQVLCVFQLVAVGMSTEVDLRFSLFPERKYITTYLREGVPIKQFIIKQNYAYYVFSLPDISTVTQINFYLTTYSGDAALIISKDIKYPSITSQSLKESGTKCNIVLEKDQISSQIYVAVYGYQFTEISLGVIVQRASDNSTAHDIPLQKGHIVTYILNKTQKVVNFRVSSRDTEEMLISVNELVGSVKLQVFLGSQPIKCEDGNQDRLSCRFLSGDNVNYTVKITLLNSEAKFTIGFKKDEQSCYPASLNTPIYVTMAPESNGCYQFNLNHIKQIDLVVSLTHIQNLNKQIEAEIQIAGQSSTPLVSMYHKIQQKDFGPCVSSIVNNDLSKTCMVIISFKNQAKSVNVFSFVMGEADAEVVLFDGLVHRIVGKNAESEEGKFFNYHVLSDRLIQIFFSTLSLKSQYYLAATFVSKQIFITRNQPLMNIYPEYASSDIIQSNDKDNRQNLYTAILGNSGLEAISITPESINKYCDKDGCYLLISVYPRLVEETFSAEEDFYEIQVTQQETYLAVGQTKTGIINIGQIYTYTIEPETGLVEFRDLNKKKSSKPCLRIQAALINGTVIKGNQLDYDLQLSQSDNIQRLYVKGIQDNCQYQIHYKSEQNPFKIAKLSYLYELDLSQGERQKFIYYHQSNRTFKITPMVSAGQIEVYILPVIGNNMKVEELEVIALDQYPIFTTQAGDFAVSSQAPEFCSQCYYFIVVTTKTKFKGQIVFSRLYDPIPLSANHMFKQALIPSTQLASQKYFYYSLTSFNITFNIISGSFNLSITNPKGDSIVSEEISNSITYSINATAFKEKEVIQYYSDRAKYVIKVSAPVQSHFYVDISKNGNSLRLFEGYPLTINLKASQIQYIEFINGQQVAKPISLMVNIVQKKANTELTLQYEVTSQGRKINNDKVVEEISKSQDNYLYSLRNLEGDYTIKIRSNTDSKITIVLAKQKLTYIAPSQNYFFDSEGIYQVHSNEKKLMLQIFDCIGQIQVQGSYDQQHFNQQFDGEMPLEVIRPNYANHFIFNIQNQQFQNYFIRVSSRVGGLPVKYLMSYYHYNDINPYTLIDASGYDIVFEKDAKGIKFTVNPPVILQGNLDGSSKKGLINIKNITYNLYLSKDTKLLNLNSKCSIRQGDSSSIQVSGDKPQIYLENQLFFGLINNGQLTIYATVEAILDIQVNHIDANYPKSLTFFYNTAEVVYDKSEIILVEKKMKYWFTDNLSVLIGWMILPFLLSAATMYYLLKCCLRRIIMRQKNMIEQVEIVPSNATIPTQQKIQEGTNGPETGAQMIKEHI